MFAKVAIALFVLVAVMAVPFAAADPTPYCSATNVSTIRENVSGIQIPDDQWCALGCNNLTGTCIRSTGYTGMEITVFLILFGIAIGALLLGIYRESMLTPLISMVLFMALSFGAFNIEYISNGAVLSYGSNIIMVLLCLVLALVSLIAVLKAVFEGMTEEKDHE
jgi:fumarate reductase subunit D